jgi:hypothetical protein
MPVTAEHQIDHFLAHGAAQIIATVMALPISRPRPARGRIGPRQCPDESAQRAAQNCIRTGISTRHEWPDRTPHRNNAWKCQVPSGFSVAQQFA